SSPAAVRRLLETKGHRNILGVAVGTPVTQRELLLTLGIRRRSPPARCRFPAVAGTRAGGGELARLSRSASHLRRVADTHPAWVMPGIELRDLLGASC